MMTGGYPGLPGLDTQYYVCNYGPAGNYYGQEVYREISSILIGQSIIGPSVHGSHLSLCHKEPARSKQNTPSRGYFAFQSP